MSPRHSPRTSGHFTPNRMRYRLFWLSLVLIHERLGCRHRLICPTCMSLYALGAFCQRSVPPPRRRGTVCSRETAWGCTFLPGDLDELNRIRVRAERVNELLDDGARRPVGVPLSARCSTVGLRNYFNTRCPTLRAELDTAAPWPAKGRWSRPGFVRTHGTGRAASAESFAMEDVQPCSGGVDGGRW